MKWTDEEDVDTWCSSRNSLKQEGKGARFRRRLGRGSPARTTRSTDTQPDDSEAEIWSLRFKAAKLFLRLGAPLVPILSSDPASILAETPN